MSTERFFSQSFAVCAALAIVLKLLATIIAAKSVTDSASQGPTYDEIDAYLEQQVERLSTDSAHQYQNKDFVNQNGEFISPFFFTPLRTLAPATPLF